MDIVHLIWVSSASPGKVTELSTCIKGNTSNVLFWILLTQAKL